MEEQGASLRMVFTARLVHNTCNILDTGYRFPGYQKVKILNDLLPKGLNAMIMKCMINWKNLLFNLSIE